jgi:hypothetical protein
MGNVDPKETVVSVNFREAKSWRYTDVNAAQSEEARRIGRLQPM